MKKSQHQANTNSLAQLDYDSYQIHCRWMEHTLKLARIAGNAGEVPVAAIIVNGQGKLLAEAGNRKLREQDPTAHAEMIAIRTASKAIKNCYLKNCTLYVTLEPCPMCAGALVHSRLSLLVYGADDPKTGAIRTVMNIPDSYCSNHSLQVLSGIKEKLCRQQLQTWFNDQRK